MKKLIFNSKKIIMLILNLKIRIKVPKEKSILQEKISKINKKFLKNLFLMNMVVLINKKNKNLNNQDPVKVLLNLKNQKILTNHAIKNNY